MPRSITAPILALAVAILAFHGAASAQAPAPGPSAGADCLMTLLNMSDCLSYVSVGSNDTAPVKQCCPELAGLVESSPSCLCQLLSNPDKVGLNIDVKRAMKLPSACNVSTPPVSLCAVLGFPVGAAAGPAPTPLPGGEAPEAGGPTNSTTAAGNYGSRVEFFHVGFLLALAFAFLPLLL